MDRDETRTIMKILKLAYPDAYKNLSVEDANMTVDIWTEMFADYDVDIVKAAVKSYMATDTYGGKPVIGKILSKAMLLTTPQQMSEGEAWGLVYKAMGNSAYNSAEEFAKLPYEIQYTIGTPEVLRSWATQESDSLSVLQSNFQRAYRARAQYAREVKALPADARQMMGQLAGNKFDLNAYLLQEGKE